MSCGEATTPSFPIAKLSGAQTHGNGSPCPDTPDPYGCYYCLKRSMIISMGTKLSGERCKGACVPYLPGLPGCLAGDPPPSLFLFYKNKKKIRNIPPSSSILQRAVPGVSPLPI